LPPCGVQAGRLPGPVGSVDAVSTRATAIQLAATPPVVDEGGTRQLQASLIFDDQTTTPLAEGSVTWSVAGGPLTGISPTGLVTAAAVYQDSPAVARGTHQAFTATLALTVLDILPDNFMTYAGDGLPDPWQVQYFRIDNPLAGPSTDPDSDSWDNLFEYHACLDPTDPLSRFSVSLCEVAGGGLVL
jgi:hypothetical protein